MSAFDHVLNELWRASGADSPSTACVDQIPLKGWCERMGTKIGPQSDPRSELIGLGCNSTCEHSISGNTVTLFHRPVVDIVMLLLITVFITYLWPSS